MAFSEIFLEFLTLLRTQHFKIAFGERAYNGPGNAAKMRKKQKRIAAGATMMMISFLETNETVVNCESSERVKHKLLI